MHQVSICWVGLQPKSPDLKSNALLTEVSQPVFCWLFFRIVFCTYIICLYLGMYIPRFTHVLNILRWVKVSILIWKFQVSVTITVIMCDAVLPFTESQVHTSECLYLKFYLDHLNEISTRSVDISKVFFLWHPVHLWL